MLVRSYLTSFTEVVIRAVVLMMAGRITVWHHRFFKACIKERKTGDTCLRLKIKRYLWTGHSPLKTNQTENRLRFHFSFLFTFQFHCCFRRSREGNSHKSHDWGATVDQNIYGFGHQHIDAHRLTGRHIPSLRWSQGTLVYSDWIPNTPSCCCSYKATVY